MAAFYEGGELVLASASPRRAELLRLAGVEFRVHAVDCDEGWREGEAPIAYALRVAAAKAELAVAELTKANAKAKADAAVVLAADTTVWLAADAAPLGKPRDRREAAAMLRALTRGQAHRVTTACSFARVGAPPLPPALAVLEQTTEVHMRTLDEARFAAFIDPYLDSDEWTDKAGGYAIQGRAAALVESIVGSYSAVVGLPLAQVTARLETLARGADA